MSVAKAVRSRLSRLVAFVGPDRTIKGRRPARAALFVLPLIVIACGASGRWVNDTTITFGWVRMRVPSRLWAKVSGGGFADSSDDAPYGA